MRPLRRGLRPGHDRRRTAAPTTSPNPDLAGVADHVARLKAADAIVLCFPTWWYGMPAILKGYFDRVWTNEVAFTLPPGGGAIRPALTNITKFWVVTTYGSPWWLMTLVLRHPGPRRAARRPRPVMRPGRQDPLPGPIEYRRRHPGPLRRFPRQGGPGFRPFLKGEAAAAPPARTGFASTSPASRGGSLPASGHETR